MSLDSAKATNCEPQRSDDPATRVYDLIKGKPNEELISVGDVRVALLVGNVKESDVQRGIELAKEHGWRTKA